MIRKLALVKKKPAERRISVRRVPVLSPAEERILSQIIQWADEYAVIKAKEDRLAYLKTPTTDKCSKHFRYSHEEMLALLNQLEKQELIIKRRRQSAGLGGNGYDGSLYSEVIPTKWGREVLSRNR